MNAVEEKKIERRVKTRKRGIAAGGTNSKQDIKPPVEEQQVAELERTFTNRWEW